MASGESKKDTISKEVCVCRCLVHCSCRNLNPFVEDNFYIGYFHVKTDQFELQKAVFHKHWIFP